MTTTTANLPAKHSAEPVLLNAFRPARMVPLWEQAAITLWFLVTYIPIPMETPIRYLMVAAFMAYFALNYQTVITLLLRSWPLFLLPIFGAFSFIWSPYSGDAMRTGILYLMTPLIVVVIASRVELRIILRCFLFTGMIATLLALPHYARFAAGGPYVSKNYLALHMTFAMFFALITVLNAKEHKLLRLTASPFVPICLVIVLMSGSTTSAIFSILGALALIGVRFLWLSITRIRHFRSLLMLIGAAFALTLTTVVINMPTNSLVTDGLELVGKDATLTGRTAIWDAGRIVSEEHPIIGVGLDGFWQRDVGMAQTINENDFKPFGTKLTFHKAYLEVQVHLGIIGLGLFILLVGWCMYRNLFTWLKTPSMEHSAMLVIAMIVFASTFTESTLWSPFNALANLFYFGAVSTLGTAHRKHIGQIPAVLRRA